MPEVPVYALSANVLAGTSDRLEAGCQRPPGKPIRAQELIR